MTTANGHDTDDEARFEALCDAIAECCAGHPMNNVRCALGALLGETFAQVPLARRDTELRHDFDLIRAYVRELPDA